MTNTVSNKVNEVETRFNALTSSQQQDAEVIDARDGETSLKARLDRDIEKAKQVYVNVEGSHISTDSSVGYAKDVEILGNTIQDASNLADIRSVGDKVEGQELYEIPVLSYGKNLLKDSLIRDFTKYTFDETYKSIGLKVEKGKAYIVSLKLIDSFSTNDLTNTYFSVSDHCNPASPTQPKYHHLISGSKYIPQTTPITSKDGYIYLCLFNQTGNTKDIFDKLMKNIEYIQLEEGIKQTPYEPYVEDKLTILSPVQLEKVGDVADRIVCKDGVWGVEKNVKSKILDGSEGWRDSWNDTYGVDGYYLVTSDISDKQAVNGVSNRFLPSSLSKPRNGEYIYFCEGGISELGINVLSSRLISKNITGFKQWLQENPALVKYATTQPQFIPLPHDQQIKLRTFANKTNISFLTEIEGTIRAQVPKSIGATVNTHTEQINNLNKELDRVKKLEESTVSTITTESDFTTVEATSNGYFEDVKLEGKTLVNLASMTGAYIRKDTGNVLANSDIPLLQGLKANTTYTRIINVSKVNLGTVNQIRMYDSFIDVNGVYKQYPWSYIKTPGVYMNTFTIGDADTTPIYKVNPDAQVFNGTTGAELEIDKMVILEGDHTQNPPSYFEGLKSVGQSTSEDGADEIVVSSVKGDGNLWNNGRITIDTNNVVPSNATSYVYLEKGEYRLSCKYTDDSDSATSFRFNVKRNDRNGEVVLGLGSMDRTISVDRNGLYYIFIDRASGHNGKFTSADIMLNKGTTPKPYTPYQSDKKRLLYYNNETQTWEKPILRQWDSIEKHANGKYYYHQRSGEVVIDNNSNIVTRDSGVENGTNNLYSYGVVVTEVISNDSNAINTINNRFNDIKFNDAYYLRKSGVSVSNVTNSKAIVIISECNTIEALKNDLSENSITVVYKLAEEKVYECTNIDLITYANETNYVVESGAIVPRTTLKVHNNISNVVSLLQKKVSLLESNITSYMITQNRLMLASRYNADTVSFKVDVASFSDTFEYDNDLYELILNNVLVGKDNYNRENIENLIIFYWMDFIISDEMYSTLFEIIEEQHNPKIEEETPLI